MSDIVDEARLLRSGDVVAIKPRGLLTIQEHERLARDLERATEKTGVMFVVFDDLDLEVYRPVDGSA